MPTPQGIETVTLHGRFVEPDLMGTPLVGQVSFTPSPAMLTFPAQDTIMAGTETATLDSNGEFFIDLPCTDTAGQNPDGWTYTVTEKLVGVRPRSYQILLPATMTVVELADITPTPAAPEYLPVVGPQGPPGVDGVIQTINGITGSDIVLTASDIGAVDISVVGVANGVASLGIDGLVPASQLPEGSGGGGEYVPLAYMGAASGVATLDVGIKVPSAQLDISSVAPPSVGTSAVGVATSLARSDHTHGGVDLTTAQSIGGAKTFTEAVDLDSTLDVAGLTTLAGTTISGAATMSDTATVATSLGVGITSSLAGKVHVRTSTAAQAALAVENNSGTSTASILDVIGDVAEAVLLAGRVGTEAQAKFALKGTGVLEFGPGGATARDTTLTRTGVGVLTISGQLASATAAPTAPEHLARKDYVDDQIAANTGGGTASLATEQTFTALKTFERTNLTDPAIRVRKAGDAAARLEIRANGSMYWDSDSTLPNNFLSYFSGDSDFAQSFDMAYGLRVLANTDVAEVDKACFAVSRGDALTPHFQMYPTGSMYWGDGTGVDVNLYRGAFNQLKSDVNFQANNYPGVWVSWTPTWTTTSGSSTPSFGNAVKNCYWTRLGDTVCFYIDITFGSTTNFGASPSGSDNWQFGMPINAARAGVPAGYAAMAAGDLVKATSGMAVFNSVGVITLYVQSAPVDGTNTAGGYADSVSPESWASGDKLFITGQYPGDPADFA